MERIAIILPAYNEQETIGETMRAFHRALPGASIYVINNNSRDRTREVATTCFAELHCAGRVIDEPRQGKGNALRRAFRDIDADYYVVSDGDLTYPAERVADLVAPLREGRADMVVGDRLSAGQCSRVNDRPFHEFGNRLVRGLVNLLFVANVHDVMSGYRAFSRQFVKNYPLLVEGFQIETDMTLHAVDKRFRILEIPVEYRRRPSGSTSKLNTFSDGAKVIYAIFQVLRYYRPLAFFTSLAAICGLVGLLAAIPVFVDWFSIRYINHVPSAILAAALEIVAVLLFAVGLILDSVAHQQRMNYERQLLSEGR